MKTFLVAVLWIHIVSLVNAMPILAKSDGCVATSVPQKTFRFPVVIKGASWLRGRSIHSIQGWTFRSGKWSKIPIQIDEVNADENYVLEGGIPFTSGTDDEIFDNNDELSIKGTSLGEPFNGKKLSKDLKASLIDFARVDFCGERDAYLGSVLIGEVRSITTQDVFQPLFDPTLSKVETSKYKYVFRSGQPMLIGDVMVKTSDGPKQVFAGSSFVMPLIPRIFVLPSFYFGEKDFTSEVESWRSGPVRSIVAVGAKLRRFFGALNLHLFSELVFYDDYFQIPTKIEFVFDPSSYLSRGSGMAYILRYSKDAAWSLDANLEFLPASGPGYEGFKKTAFDHSPSGVFSVKGHSKIGSFMANVRVDEKALKQSPPPYLALEKDFSNQELSGRWPWLKYGPGSVAVFIDISGIKRGLYDFALDVALSNQAHDGFTDFQAVSAHWHDPITN